MTFHGVNPFLPVLDRGHRFHNEDILKWKKCAKLAVYFFPAIVILYNKGKYECAIASQLKLSKTCVHDIITRYKETGSNQDYLRSGKLSFQFW